jgi:hypothetical protein
MLALTAAALLCVIATQDWLVPSLRNATISSGLTGPYHVMLDVAYVPLAAALLFAVQGSLATHVFADIAALALLLVAATNTAWRWFDALTDGGHAKWHSRFTLIVFLSAIAMQCAADHGGWWTWTLWNALLPAGIYFYFLPGNRVIDGVAIAASPAAEKAFVALLCGYFILRALV